VNPKYIIFVDNQYFKVKLRLGINKYKSKCFYVSKYDGKKGALNAAIEWRDMMLTDHKLIRRLDFKHSPQIFMQKSNSPHIGVHLNRGNWTCRYTLSGREIKKHFSIAKYGNVEAFKLACNVRKKYCGKLIAKNTNKIPQ